MENTKTSFLCHSTIYGFITYFIGQGHGAIYDAKWSPDRLHVAASDSHGHVLFFGPSSSEPYQVIHYHYSLWTGYS